jgi:hypothetical protein
MRVREVCSDGYGIAAPDIMPFIGFCRVGSAWVLAAIGSFILRSWFVHPSLILLRSF